MLSSCLGGALVGRPWSLLSRTVLRAYWQLSSSQKIVTAGLVDSWLFISEEGMERVIRPLLKCQATPPNQLYTILPSLSMVPRSLSRARLGEGKHI